MQRNKKKIIRAVTVPQSLGFCREVMQKMRKDGYEMVAVSSPGPEWKGLKEDGFKCIEVPMERHISLKKDFWSLFHMIRVFRTEKPYMVHSMTPKAGMICMIAAWVTRVPCRIHTFTGLVWPTATGLKRKILMATDWLTCACATHVIPEGKGVMDDLQGHITKKPMKVLGYGNVHGVDMARFNPDRFESHKDTNAFTYIFVGRIVGDKGINELVSAFIRLHEKHNQTKLVLVGTYEENLDPVKKETLDVINSHEAIEVVGPKYGDDLVQMYIDSDCFVMPSYREGFPNTVMEAGAMGLPSVVTDINGSREIIIEGENGYIVPSKDANALHAAMEKMLTNNAAREEMAKNARSLIETRFEKCFVQNCLMDYYKEIM